MKKLKALLLMLCLLCGWALAEEQAHETPLGAVALPADATLIQEQYMENFFNGVNNMNFWFGSYSLGDQDPAVFGVSNMEISIQIANFESDEEAARYAKHWMGTLNPSCRGWDGLELEYTAHEVYSGTPVPSEIYWDCCFIKGRMAYKISIVSSDATELTQQLEAQIQNNIILPFVYPEEVASGVAVAMYDAGESAAEAKTTQIYTTSRYAYDVPANWTCSEEEVVDDGSIEYTSASWYVDDLVGKLRNDDDEERYSRFSLNSVRIGLDYWKQGNWIDYASGYRNLAEAWEYECSHYFENQISEQYEDSLNGYKVIYSLTDDSVVLLWIDGPLKVTITADYYTEEAGVDSFAAYFTEFIAAPVLDSLRAVDGETVR